MKKGLVVGLEIAMFLAFLLPTVVSAQKKTPSLPDGARLLQPSSVHKIGERGEVLETLSPNDDGVISEPYIYTYVVPGREGARLRVGASASFPITGFDLWADGQRVGAAVTTFFSGTIPNLVPGDSGIQQDLGFLTPEILRVGIHSVEVSVYPDYPRSNVHFLGAFTIEVKWFEFGVSVCKLTQPPDDAQRSDQTFAQLSFYISPIGEMPKAVTIVAPPAFSTGETEVVNGIATVVVESAAYDKHVSGQEFFTTVTEVGGAERSSTQLLRYPPLDELSLCGGKG